MEKYVYQLFILGLENPFDALKKGLGGVIFFTKDIQTQEKLIKDIKTIKGSALIPPFISIDQEGGRVERTENIRPKRLSQRFAYQNGKLLLQSEEIAKELNINATLINPVYLTGVDENLLNSLKQDHKIVITLESGVLDGGFGEKISRFYSNSDMKVLNYGAKKEFTDRVPLDELYKRYRLTPQLITEDIKKIK